MPQRKAHRGCQPDMTKKRMAARLRQSSDAGVGQGSGSGGRGSTLPNYEGYLPFPEQGRTQSCQLVAVRGAARTGLIFRNPTNLDSARLRRMFLDAILAWPTVALSV